MALALIFCIDTTALAQSAEIYAQAKQAYDRQQFREAAQGFAKAAEVERALPPESRTDALFMQARSLVNLGEFAAAEPVLHAYLSQAEKSYQALYLLGYVLGRENKPKESLEVFARAAAISTPRPEDLRLVALDYVLLDDYGDAIHWLDRAVEGDPTNGEAWYDLGRAHMHLGDFAESERDFKRVIAMDPNAARALDNLGLSYEAQSRFDEALTMYGRAIEAQKNSPHPSDQPLLNRGALLNTMSRFAEAAGPLKQAVALSPASSRCHEELARAYIGTHRNDLAREEMERAVSLEPNSPSLHYQLGQIYRRAGLAGRAQAELKKSADLYGTRSATMEEGRRSGSSRAVHP